ncbi:uncharacterized protein METZ01_LOCUS475909, partial [marine metagenome]
MIQFMRSCLSTDIGSIPIGLSVIFRTS